MKRVEGVEVAREYDRFGPITLRVPKGARVLGVGIHNARPYLWVERAAPPNDDPPEYEDRKFEVAHDGYPVTNGARWVGCVSQSSALLWHLYESLPPSRPSAGRDEAASPSAGLAGPRSGSETQAPPPPEPKNSP